MRFFDWLLTDPTQADGGFLAALFPDLKTGGTTPSPLAPGGTGSLLGEAPLINLLRSGFAGMNAADGYAGFGPQFAAGVKGGADAMAERRQQIFDQMNALSMRQAQQAKAGMTDGEDSGAEDQAAAPSAKPCAACASAAKAMARRQAPGAGSAPSSPVIVTSTEEAGKLPPGTWFMLPDGRVRQSGAAEALNG